MRINTYRKTAGERNRVRLGGRRIGVFDEQLRRLGEGEGGDEEGCEGDGESAHEGSLPGDSPLDERRAGKFPRQMSGVFTLVRHILRKLPVFG